MNKILTIFALIIFFSILAEAKMREKKSSKVQPEKPSRLNPKTYKNIKEDDDDEE